MAALLGAVACGGDSTSDSALDRALDPGPEPSLTTEPEASPEASPDVSAPPVTAPGASIDLGEGLTLDVLLLADGGLFDPDLDVVFTTAVELTGLETDVVVGVDYEFRSRLESTVGSVSQLLRVDDERTRVIVRRDAELPDLGRYSVILSGTVEATDGSFELPFERTIAFQVTEDGPAPVEELELVDGAISIEASRRWRITAPTGSFTVVTESGIPDEPIPFDLDDAETLVEVSGRDGRFVVVLRALTPRHLVELDEIVAQIPERWATAGEVFADPVPIELGGLEGLRLVRTAPGPLATIDVLVWRDEVFVVFSSTGDDPARAAEVEALRDSIRFHPDRFERLTHRGTYAVWFIVDGEPYLEVEIAYPANWRTDPEVEGSVMSPTSGRRLDRLRADAEGFTFDELVDDFIDELLLFDLDPFVDVSDETDVRGGLPVATIRFVGDRQGDLTVVLVSDGTVARALLIRDDPVDPDPGLIDAMVATARPVGPPSTNDF